MIRAISKSVPYARSVSTFLHRFSTSMYRNPIEGISRKHLVYSANEGHVVQSPYESISIPEMTVDQYVWKNMAKWKNHVAIVCGVTGRKYTYAKLRDHCAALAIRLRTNLLLEKGDIVAICMPNVPEYAIALLGSIEAGLVVTTVNPGYTSEEISRQLISSRPKLIVCLIDNYDVVKQACTLAKQPNIKIVATKTEIQQSFRSEMINFTELMNPKGLRLTESSKFHKDTADFEQMALLPYSSGTTGLPKGVMLSHNNLTSNCETYDVNLPYERLILPTTNDYQDVLPCFLPFYHAYGLVVLLLSKLALGCKIVSMPKYDLNDLIRVIGEHKATFLCLVPPIVIQLGNSKDLKQFHFQNVKRVMCAASNLAKTDAERFKEISVNSVFFQGYGLTETSPIATLTPLGVTNYATIGWPASNTEIKIASLDDAKFKGVEANATGELLVRGPNVMKGYFQNDEATKAMITEDGWLRTGDIGYYDDDGLFYINDRLKELIKVNANQVPPAELEGILREHPDVLDAVVIGISHATCGEVPKAFIVRRPESNVTSDDLQQFVAKQVIKYKQLTGGVQFVDSIPKTATGKILRREIRKLYL